MCSPDALAGIINTNEGQRVEEHNSNQTEDYWNQSNIQRNGEGFHNVNSTYPDNNMNEKSESKQDKDMKNMEIHQTESEYPHTLIKLCKF